MNGPPALSVIRRLVFVAGGLLAVIGAAQCSPAGPTQSTVTTLRMGLGNITQVAAQSGLRQLIAILSGEGLAAPLEDGRLRPWLAENWTIAPDAMSITLQLRRNATFHDGTPVKAQAVIQTLEKSLPPLMGPAFDDVERITAPDDWHVRFNLRRPSQFPLEALETLIQKPGAPEIGTAPYRVRSGTGDPELQAYPDHYLGRPGIERIVLKSYPSVRAAWAELLRGNIDMLYEVNVDALDSLERSSNIQLFSYVRHYQYMIVFSPRAEVLKSAAVRRELNAAIDRAAIIKEAFGGHGVPSVGSVPPTHWALDQAAPRLTRDPALAMSLAKRHLRFTCLVPADSVYERVALVIKQQLAAASVDMQVRETTQEQAVRAYENGEADALLGDIVSGPSLFRSYRHWHSKMDFHPEPLTSPAVDATLEQIRHAASDAEYRSAVTAFQRAIVDDPPALFIAWGERARAVSKSFKVTAPEGGRDILNTLRLWRPNGPQRVASVN